MHPGLYSIGLASATSWLSRPPGSLSRRTSIPGGIRMRLKGRFRLSYANVVGTIALFIALCGGTAAAKVVITGKNIKNNTVTGADIRNYSLASKDLKKGLLASANAAPLSSAAFQASRDAGPTGVAPSQNYTS